MHDGCLRGLVDRAEAPPIAPRFLVVESLLYCSSVLQCEIVLWFCCCAWTSPLGLGNEEQPPLTDTAFHVQNDLLRRFFTSHPTRSLGLDTMFRTSSACALLANTATYRCWPIAHSATYQKFRRCLRTDASARWFAASTRTASQPSTAEPQRVDTKEDDRWHAAYLQSLMNKAGELRVRGKSFKAPV